MSYEVTKNRIGQWIGIILILAVFAGAYWYFKVYGSTLNQSQNDLATNGLVGLWSFNGDDISGTTAYDRSGNSNNGTLFNTPPKTTGKVGQALSFNGSNQYVAVAQAATINTFTAVTMSAWVYPSVTSGNYIIARKNNDTGGINHDLYQLDISSNKPRFLVAANGSGVKTAGGDTTISAGQWYHVVGTWDGTTAKLYVNQGQEKTTAALSGTIATSTTNSFGVGVAIDVPDGYYSGKIDELRLYNRALSVGEIQSLYLAGGGTKSNTSISQPQGTGRLDSGLAGYWKLDDGSGTTATDASTNGNNGTLTNGPTWTTGQIGGAIDFDGTNDYVTVADNNTLDITQSITLSTWANFDTLSAPRLFSPAKYETTGNQRSYRMYTDNAVSELRFSLSRDGTSGNTTTIAYSTSNLTTGTWYHITGTYDGVTMRLYVNGTQVSSGAHSGGIYASTAPLQIGTAESTSQFHDGKIDEVRVYSRSLSADEVSQLYRLTTPTDVDTSLKGYWSFDGHDMNGTTAYDRSGTGNTGTLTNGPVKALGMVGQALSFDGTDDYATVADANTLDITGAISMGVWVKTSDTDSCIMSKSVVSTSKCFEITGNKVYELGILSSVIYFQTSNGTTANVLSGSASPILDNKWHYLVATWDGTTGSNGMKLYLDGNVWYQGTATVSTIQATSSAFNFGGDGGSYDYAGLIDEGRLYNRALSAAEIKALYDVGAPDSTNSSLSQPQGTGRLDSGLAGYWPLDNGSGTSATDSSTNGNTGTLTNGPTWGTGQVGGDVVFDGTDDYIIIGSSIKVDNADRGVISAWVKFNNWTSIDAFYNPVFSYGGPGALGAGNLQLEQRYFTSTHYLAVEQGNNNETRDIVRGSTALALSTWYHVAVVSDGVSYKLYLNGVPETLTVFSGSNTGDWFSDMSLGETDQSVIGARYGNGSIGAPLNGALDEVRIYNRPMTDDEISQLYRLGSPTAADSSLKGYWSFNGQDMNGTTAYDRSGAGNSGTLTSGPTKTIGKIGQALSFDGVNDYVDVTNTSYAGEFTYSWWYKTANNSQTGIMIGGDTTGGSYVKFGLVSGNYFIRVIGGGSSDNTVAPASVNTWHHMVVTRNSSNKVDLYVDGGSATRLFTDVAQSGTTTVDYIASSADGQIFSGQMDEVRTYNRAFTAAEVAALYNQGR